MFGFLIDSSLSQREKMTLWPCHLVDNCLGWEAMWVTEGVCTEEMLSFSPALPLGKPRMESMCECCRHPPKPKRTLALLHSLPSDKMRKSLESFYACLFREPVPASWHWCVNPFAIFTFSWLGLYACGVYVTSYEFMHTLYIQHRCISHHPGPETEDARPIRILFLQSSWLPFLTPIHFYADVSIASC